MPVETKAENMCAGLSNEWIPTESQTPLFEDAFREFISLKKLNGTRDATIRMYLLNVLFFYRPAIEDGVVCAEWMRDERRKLIAWMEGEFGPAPKSARRNRMLVCLRAFWNWCLEQGWCKWEENPAKGIKTVSEATTIRDIDLEKIQALKDKFEYTVKQRPNHWESVRNYIVFLVQLDTGIRPGELFRLVRGEIEFSGSGKNLRCEIHLPSSKTKNRKSRDLGVSLSVAPILQKFINWHQRIFASPDTPLFCNRKGRAFTINSWGHKMKTFASEIGVDLMPYDLRHAFGTTLARQGVNAQVLAKTMGHSVQMTERYIHLAEKDRQEIAELSPAAVLARGGEKRTIDSGKKKRVKSVFSASGFDL